MEEYSREIAYVFEGGIQIQEIEISNNYRLEDIEYPPQTNSSQLEKTVKAN